MKPIHVLFLCTGNSARSIMAESILNHLGQGRVRAFSAGSHPTGRVNDLALETLQRLGCPTDGLRSKSWDEFAGPGAPELDVILTVCDNAAGEACPLWPGRPTTAHWGVEDPAAATGTAEERRAVFGDIAAQLRRRIERLLTLPLTSLDQAALQAELRAIGRAG